MAQNNEGYEGPYGFFPEFPSALGGYIQLSVQQISFSNALMENRHLVVVNRVVFRLKVPSSSANTETPAIH